MFVRNKPVKLSEILQKMIMFLTDKTKTDFAQILILTLIVVRTFQESAMPGVYNNFMFAPCHH